MRNCCTLKKPMQETHPPVRRKRVENGKKKKEDLVPKPYNNIAAIDLERARKNMKRWQQEYSKLKRGQMNMSTKITSDEIGHSDNCEGYEKYDQHYGNLEELYGNNEDFLNGEN